MRHLPILRQGRPYYSVDRARAIHHRTKEPFVEISQANVGLIRRDFLQLEAVAGRLSDFTSEELIRLCASAAGHFANSTLPLGEGTQTPQEYVEATSATTGLPYNMVRRNQAKIEGVLANMAGVLRGLTRNLDLSILDRGHGEAAGTVVSYFRRTDSLGVVLPSNSPGVHSLWAPAFALKTPLVLKPGGQEPWTPYRMIQALIRAGAPPEAFSYYPADHAGAGEILRRCGRGMVFGDVSTTRVWARDPRVEVHGPGWSKVVIGDDMADRWPEYIDVIAASIAENSGRSCVNASGVWTPRHGRAIAETLAAKLAAIQPRAADDPEAAIAPFADPGVARRMNQMIDGILAEPGAIDLSEAAGRGPRLAEHDGCAYLLPTIVWCDSPSHPAANKEFLFPYASVVEAPVAAMPGILGPTLVCTAITEDRGFQQRLLAAQHIGRLNFGPIKTIQIVWDQPHEGNLFEHLYARRAFQTMLEPATA
ncbi:MAG: aldehyde dehydrogenase family protein [Bryobacterales bacterium]|nr:aldehyde dehydrogenase family protein [Bryobacterales bacterium]